MFLFVCVLIQAYLPTSLSVALCASLLLVNLPGTAALSAQSHFGCKWNLKAKEKL